MCDSHQCSGDALLPGEVLCLPKVDEHDAAVVCKQEVASVRVGVEAPVNQELVAKRSHQDINNTRGIRRRFCVKVSAWRYSSAKGQHGCNGVIRELRPP